jgi:hypothetical protein
VSKQTRVAQAVGVLVGAAVALAVLAAITGTVYWVIAAGAALCAAVVFRAGLILRR